MIELGIILAYVGYLALLTYGYGKRRKQSGVESGRGPAPFREDGGSDVSQ